MEPTDNPDLLPGDFVSVIRRYFDDKPFAFKNEPWFLEEKIGRLDAVYHKTAVVSFQERGHDVGWGPIPLKSLAFRDRPVFNIGDEVTIDCDVEFKDDAPGWNHCKPALLRGCMGVVREVHAPLDASRTCSYSITPYGSGYTSDMKGKEGFYPDGHVALFGFSAKKLRASTVEDRSRNWDRLTQQIRALGKDPTFYASAKSLADLDLLWRSLSEH